MNNYYRFFFLLAILVLFNHTFAQNFDNGFNFYLPPDDTTSQRFLPHFPINPIEPDRFVSVENGHFAVAGERIRFFGTNSVAEGAFPDQSKAAFVAGRLRKMGFNLIRFHHLDNGWSRESLFEWGQDTRHLNPVTLDRMEKYISELKNNGIYIDMNLHVSRRFNTKDGVAVADSILNFGKGVVYFDPQLIDLQKEYAGQLLTHVNPYTGLALRDDPIMAMVEITNENSLYRMWRSGAVRKQSDGGDFTGYHVHMLDDLWTDYLQAKYADTEELKAEWNQGIRPKGSDDQVKDGTFETDPISRNWVLEQHETAKANMTIDDSNPFEGSKCALINVTSVTGTDWHIQWKQTRLSLVKDSLSTVTFAGRSDGKRNVSVAIQKDSSPWTVYYSANFQLGEEWKTFQFSYRSPVDNGKDTRLSFSLGKETGAYWFDDIHLGTSGVKGLQDDEHLEDGTVRRIAYSQCVNFTDNRVRDMSAFYKKVQDDYFAEMSAFLRNLGVRAPITGTNWNVGPADLAVQSRMNYIDNHAYWDHPRFPNIPWSANDWDIRNTPMVRDDNGGTIARLFGGVPVSGMPLTISEYNHGFPNRYQSEGVLFLTGYSGFYDIDGPMFFNYGGSQNDWQTDMVSGYFSIHRNTAMMSLIPSCAYAFRSGMIAPSRQPIDLAYSRDDILLLPKWDNLYWAGPDIFPAKLALEHAVRNVDFSSPQDIDLDNFPPEPTSPYRTDTDEITWDTNGLLQVAAERFIGLTGFLQDYPNKTTGPLTLKSASGFATMTWVSLTDDKLVDAQRSLLTVSTTLQNSGMVWDGLHTVHDDWGGPPTEMRPVMVTLGLTMHADSVRLYTLDETGKERDAGRSYTPVSDNHFEIILDQNVNETVWWGLEKIGLGAAVDEKQDIQQAPKAFELQQNWPNPFNTQTTITFVLPVDADTEIAVYDIQGRRVRLLANRKFDAGSHRLLWDGCNDDGSPMSSGLYFFKMSTDGITLAEKAMLIK